MHSIVPNDEVTALGPARPAPAPLARPVGMLRAALGFPSPAEDFVDDSLDLNELLVRNPPATFFYRACGNSMREAGIYSGDVLVVDRSVEPAQGDIVVAIWDGNAPACKVLRLCGDHVELHSCNAAVSPIVLAPEAQLAAATSDSR